MDILPQKLIDFGAFLDHFLLPLAHLVPDGVQRVFFAIKFLIDFLNALVRILLHVIGSADIFFRFPRCCVLNALSCRLRNVGSALDNGLSDFKRKHDNIFCNVCQVKKPSHFILLFSLVLFSGYSIADGIDRNCPSKSNFLKKNLIFCGYYYNSCGYNCNMFMGYK